MTPIRRLSGAALLLVSALVSAEAAAGGHHQICYQDQPVNGAVTAVFACRADDPTVSCTVSVVAPGVATVSHTFGPGWTTDRLTFPGTGSFTGQFQFMDGVVRSCGVSLKGAGTTIVGPPSAGASLVGFTTDASGLVTTGVWTMRSNANATRVGQTLMVPYGYLAVGGGGTGAEVPFGALLYQSHREGGIDWRQWQISTQDDIFAQPHDNDVYAIGLKIEGLSVASLLPLLNVQSAVSGSSPLLANPTAGVVRPAGFVPLGGTFDAWAPPAYPPPPAQPLYYGQYATASYPMLLPNFCHPACEEPFSAVGWMVESKDHGVSRPGWVKTELLSLPDHVTVNGVTYVVLGSVASATSAVAGHPSVVVPGKRGEYALTGVGAFVDWKTTPGGGNLLWKLIPRPDIGGVEAASKDHGIVSPAAITGYALGIKLVDTSTLQPPPVLQPPFGSFIPRP